MRTRTIPATPWSLAALSLCASAGYAGPLSPPPGPVAPTHKTLTDVEPRIAVGAATTPGNAQFVHVIAAPGSYYLAANVQAVPGKSGIAIAADHVTLDLNGFSIIGTGTAPAQTGLVGVDSPRGFVLRNGTITRYAYGVGGSFGHALFEDVAILDNLAGGLQLATESHACIFRGVRVAAQAESGILAGTGALVERCTVEGGATGIAVLHGGEVTGCTVIGAATGIDLFGGGIARSCTVRDGQRGIAASGPALVEGCSVSGTGSLGIEAAFGATVRACTVASCPVGIADSPLLGGRTVVDSNTVLDCPLGVRLQSSGTMAVRNRISGSATAPVQAAPGNAVGAVTPTPVGAGPWDNVAN